MNIFSLRIMCPLIILFFHFLSFNQDAQAAQRGDQSVIVLKIDGVGKFRNFQKTLFIYDNKDLRGKPVYQLNNEGLKKFQKNIPVGGVEASFLKKTSPYEAGLIFYNKGEENITLFNKM